MQILVISNYYPPFHLGGQEQSCQQVVEGLRARGHQVNVLTSRQAAKNSRVKEDSVQRSLYPEMARRPYQAAFDFFVNRNRHKRANLQNLRQAVNRWQPDLIFIWGMWNLPHSLAAEAERLKPGRVVYRFADYWPTLPSQYELYWRAQGRGRLSGWLKEGLKPLALAILRRAKPAPRPGFRRAFCVSQATRQALIEAGIPVEDAAVIHTGLQADAFVRAATTRQSILSSNFLRVLFAGRFSPEKGVDTLLAALQLLADYQPTPNMKVSLAGRGGETYLHKWHAQGISPANIKVEFLGEVPSVSMPTLYASHDVLVVPSTWEEPLSRSVMEGMAASLVVVATPRGGTPEIIRSGENGLLVPAGDPQALADCLAYLASQPQTHQRLAVAGQRTILEHFSFDQMLDRIEIFLRHTLETEPQPRYSDDHWESKQSVTDVGMTTQ